MDDELPILKFSQQTPAKIEKSGGFGNQISNSSQPRFLSIGQLYFNDLLVFSIFQHYKITTL
jgi:hypothetical protein